MADSTSKLSNNHDSGQGTRHDERVHNTTSPKTEVSSSPPNPDGAGGNRKHPLSTSSREGIQVASQITPTRLATLLIRKGPLPIRHITSHLSLEVHGFGSLSLSKQRRLIMAAMEQTDPENNVVFEKIGWGQWAVRKIDSDYIVTEGTDMDDGEKKQINVHDLRSQAGVKLGWSKKQQNTSQDKHRRESITTKQNNLHNVKLPNESLVSASAAIDLDSENDYALSDMDDVDDVDDSEDDDEEVEDEDELFTFDHDDGNKTIGAKKPIKFANRVPLKFSPPPAASSRRKSSSSNTASISKNTHAYPHSHKNIFNRSRLNSIENLDNYIFSSAKNSSVSINSPPPPVTNTISGLPLASWSSLTTSPDGIDSIAKTMSAAGTRKSSFNESHLRSTLSSSLPKQPPSPQFHSQSNLHPRSITHSSSPSRSNRRHSQNMSDTDEEDWATIGAESLRKNPHKNNNTNNGNKPVNQPDQSDERAAASALVDLMSI